MEIKKFRKLVGNLLIAGLRYMPEDIHQTIDSIWYPVLKDYDPDLIRRVVSSIILTHKQFPTISEVLYEVALEQYGIVSFETYLHRKDKEKKEAIGERDREISQIVAKDVEDYRNQKQIIYDNYNSIYPEEIKLAIDSLGGDVDKIIQYKMKDFRRIVKRSIKHKMIEEKRNKLLKDKE